MLTTEVGGSGHGSPLSQTGPERLARRIVEDGWLSRRAGERFRAAPTMAKRWPNRPSAGRTDGGPPVRPG